MDAVKEQFVIVSGEGAGEGTREEFSGTIGQLRKRLARERCSGDRWAFAIDDTGTRMPL